MLRKILVLAGRDADVGSPAVARAVQLAERAGSTVVLLGIVYDPHLEGYLGRQEIYAPLRERIVAERAERLQALAAALDKRGVRCETKALWANPAHMAVVREAAADDVDLVVVAPEDTRALSNDEWRLVSVSPSPVLVVRDREVRPYAAVVAAVDPARSYDKPTDLDDKILDLAKRLRNLSGASLEVVHCMPPFRSFIAEGAGALLEAEQALRAQRQQELEELLEQAQLPPESGTLVEGKPADVLVERSAGAAPTLLVLGTVQRGPIARLLVGSTAERVLRSDGGDVAVIRPAFVGADAEGAGDADSARRHVERDPSELE